MRGDVIYKVAAFLIALSLAVFVYGERNPYETRAITVPLVTTGADPGIIVKSAPKSIVVDVSGPRDLLNTLDANIFRATVDLRGKRAGTQSLDIRLHPIAGAVLPADISVVPRTTRVAVSLAGVTRQSRAIEPVFLQPPPPGFTYSAATVVPATAVVSGTADAVKSVARLQVVVDVSVQPGQPINAAFAVQAVNAAGETVSGVKVSPAQARVRTQVQNLPGEKEIFVSPNITGLPIPDLKIAAISVVPQSVIVTGNPEALRRLNFAITQEVNVSGAEGTVIRSVALNLPDGVSVQGSRRVRVEVRLVPR